VQLLAEAKVRIDKCNPSGQTDLVRAEKHNMSDLVKLLVRCNATSNKVDDTGRTTLDIAQQYWQEKVVKVLLQVGAGANKAGIAPFSNSSQAPQPDQLAALMSTPVGALSQIQASLATSLSPTTMTAPSSAHVEQVVRFLMPSYGQLPGMMPTTYEVTYEV